jgi:hypothetical protein
MESSRAACTPSGASLPISPLKPYSRPLELQKTWRRWRQAAGGQQGFVRARLVAARGKRMRQVHSRRVWQDVGNGQAAKPAGGRREAPVARHAQLRQLRGDGAGREASSKQRVQRPEVPRAVHVVQPQAQNQRVSHEAQHRCSRVAHAGVSARRAKAPCRAHARAAGALTVVERIVGHVVFNAFVLLDQCTHCRQSCQRCHLSQRERQIAEHTQQPSERWRRLRRRRRLRRLVAQLGRAHRAGNN